MNFLYPLPPYRLCPHEEQQMTSNHPNGIQRTHSESGSSCTAPANPKIPPSRHLSLSSNGKGNAGFAARRNFSAPGTFAKWKAAALKTKALRDPWAGYVESWLSEPRLLFGGVGNAECWSCVGWFLIWFAQCWKIMQCNFHLAVLSRHPCNNWSAKKNQKSCAT